jgi:DNA-binding protein H-NS
MARPKSLAKMSLDALIDLRDSVTTAIGEQAESLRKQLASLTGDSSIGHVTRRGRPPGRERSPLKGRKAPVKYRDKRGNKWSGRGAQPRWMAAAIKAGAKREDFLIGKPRPKAKNAAKKSARKSKPAKKRVAKRKVAPAAPSPAA